MNWAKLVGYSWSHLRPSVVTIRCLCTTVQKTLSIPLLFSPPILVKWDFLEMVSRCSWGRWSSGSSSLQFSKCRSNIMVFLASIKKKGWMAGPLSKTDSLPSSCSQTLQLWAEVIFFSSQLEEVEQEMLNDGQVCRHCAALLRTEGDHWFALQTPT